MATIKLRLHKLHRTATSGMAGWCYALRVCCHGEQNAPKGTPWPVTLCIPGDLCAHCRLPRARPHDTRCEAHPAIEGAGDGAAANQG